MKTIEKAININMGIDMKKCIKNIVLFFCAILLVGCTSVNKRPGRKLEGREILQSNIETTLISHINGGSPDYKINDEDYKKFNNIMNYLDTHYNVDEDILYEQLALSYGESPESLKAFIGANMSNAIDRDFGVTENNVKIGDNEITNAVVTFFETNVIDERLLDISTNDTDVVSSTGLRGVTHGELLYDGHMYEYIIKTEFSNDFKKVNVFQLKIDGLNIDL